MYTFNVECQVNANDDRVVVSVQAGSISEAWRMAEEIIRSQIGQNGIRGCVVAGVSHG